MPLKSGCSDKSVGENVKTEMREGKPKKQALAIALEKQREALRKAGKKIK